MIVHTFPLKALFLRTFAPILCANPAYTHTHTHTHTNTHTHTHTHIHTREGFRTRMHLITHFFLNPVLLVREHICLQTQAHIRHTQSYKHIHLFYLTPCAADVCVCLAYMHVHMHTHTNTHTHTNKHLPISPCCRCMFIQPAQTHTYTHKHSHSLLPKISAAGVSTFSLRTRGCRHTNAHLYTPIQAHSHSLLPDCCKAGVYAHSACKRVGANIQMLVHTPIQAYPHFFLIPVLQVCMRIQPARTCVCAEYNCSHIHTHTSILSRLFNPCAAGVCARSAATKTPKSLLERLSVRALGKKQ